MTVSGLLSFDDRAELTGVVDDLVAWAPDGVVVVDSIGEIFPMLGVSSNDNDEVTAGLRRVLSPLAKAGAAVVAIDHKAKSTESGQGSLLVLWLRSGPWMV